MAPLSFEQIVVLLTMVGTGIAFIFGKPTLDAIKSFGDWWLEAKHKRLEMEAKQRQLKLAEEEQKARAMSLDEELNDKGHKYIIRRQDRRIGELEKLCTAFQTETHNCREDFRALVGKCEMLEESNGRLDESNSRMSTQLALLTSRLELLAPGIGNASDSKVRRYFERLGKMKKKSEVSHDDSGEIDLGNQS